MLPQALPWLAASLRAKLPEAEVRIIDCMPLHLGWASLEREIAAWRPDVVAAGENHALYVAEVLRLFEVVARVAPSAKRVAGGTHFTHLPDLYLGRHPIDAIVMGEGEISFSELIAELSAPRPDLSRVPGVAWWNGDEAVINEPRALIHDLSSLPQPAYELLPMHLYGRSRYLFSPGATTIHHSRGCTQGCTFCAWWTAMADREVTEDGSVCLHPRWRTRSVEHVIEEIETLYYRYGRRSLVWVDASWNISARWTDAWAEEVLRRGLRLSSMTFMRADDILRDHELGILDKQVRAGINHMLIGVERADEDDLLSFNKRFYKGGAAEQAIAILRERYPQVFIQATFIVGTRDESRESLARQLALAKRLRVDFPAFHPITPVPGTPLFDEAIQEGWVTVDDFERFDWMNPLMDSRYLTRQEIAEAMADMDRVFVNPRWLLKGFFSRTPYRRDMYRWFAIVSARMALDNLKQRLNPLDPEHYQALVEPDWYSA